MLTPLVGALGAVVDERYYAGFSSWMSLCRAEESGALQALLLQAQLMPMALGAMLTFALLGTLAVGTQRERRDGARVMLAAHTGCVLAVVAGGLVCPRLFGGLGSTPLALGGMALFETAITTAAALLLLRPLLRDAAAAAQRRVAPANSPRSTASPMTR